MGLRKKLEKLGVTVVVTDDYFALVMQDNDKCSSKKSVTINVDDKKFEILCFKDLESKGVDNNGI